MNIPTCCHDPNAVTVWVSDQGTWTIERRDWNDRHTYVVVDHRKHSPFTTRYLPAYDTTEDPRIPAYVRNMAYFFTAEPDMR